MLRAVHFLMILAGSLITAIGINLFIVPANLASGGMFGFFLVLQHKFGLPAGVMYMLANIPFAYWMYRLTGWQGVLKTVVGFLSFSIFADLTAPLTALHVTNNPLLACVYGGLLSGIGGWLVFIPGASTGGMGLVAFILKRIKGTNPSQVYLLTDIVVLILAGLAFNSLEVSLYSWLATYVSSNVLDRLSRGFRAMKMLKVNSRESKQIARALMDDLHRGVTLYTAVGAYTGEDRYVVECVMASSEVPSALERIKQVDPEAMVMIVEIPDVRGRGFTADSEHRTVPIWKRGAEI